jgi:hypothetical protein
MSNAFDDVRTAVEQAQFQLEAADSVATNMAKLLVGRLRRVNRHNALAALKRDLQDYNIQTGKWKELGHG